MRKDFLIVLSVALLAFLLFWYLRSDSDSLPSEPFSQEIYEESVDISSKDVPVLQGILLEVLEGRRVLLEIEGEKVEIEVPENAFIFEVTLPEEAQVVGRGILFKQGDGRPVSLQIDFDELSQRKGNTVLVQPDHSLQVILK